MARPSLRYAPPEVVLLRASTVCRPWPLVDAAPNPDGPDAAAAAAARAWLEASASDEAVRAAVTPLYPALWTAVERLVVHPAADERKLRRAVLALASILLRWQGRPTPFGRFAGVGAAHVGPVPHLSVVGVRTVARADAEWLGTLVARLHGCCTLLARLTVVVNNAGSVRGDRFVVPDMPPRPPQQGLAPSEVSVRLTRPVRALIEGTRRPTPVIVVRERLAAAFPHAPAASIDGMLRGLLDQQILLSSLDTPLAGPDPLGHLCARLDAVDAHDIDEISGLVAEVETIRGDLAEEPELVEETASWMREIAPAVTAPICLDTALDASCTIPETVVHEAQAAAEALLRLSQHPHGSPAWRDYHRRFRARYGPDARVPVLDLVSDAGLGYPSGYLDSAHGQEPRPLTARDEWMIARLQAAAVDGSDEIVLTDRDIDELTNGGTITVPPRIEIAVTVHASTVDALAAGRFRLLITGAPRPGSSMAGRLAHLLDEPTRTALTATYTATEPGALPAQLVFAPRRWRNHNVTHTAQFLPHVVAIGDPPTGRAHTIGLEDLAVTADAHAFALERISTGDRVEPRVVHALEATAHTPPLARLLSELGTARCAVYQPFRFGPVTHLPHLPRVRYRRTVLAPARWLLAPSDLPAPAAERPETWAAGFAAWRKRWNVPAHVALIEGDARLPLDLDVPLHRRILRTHLDRGHRVELHETTTPDDLGWTGGRAHELLIPLIRTPPPAAPRVPTKRAVVRHQDVHLPGVSPVLLAQLTAHPGRFDEILTEHVPALLARFGADQPAWWFHRHRTAIRPQEDQHLALHLRLGSPAAYGAAATHLGAWVGELRALHLAAEVTLATYHPQHGRFGCGRAMKAAHAVFAADSAAALVQIDTARRLGVAVEALAAASMVNIAEALAPTPEQGRARLLDELPREHGRIDPALTTLVPALTDPESDLRATLAPAWGNRAQALRVYRLRLAEERDPMTALRSLLHLHHVRAVEADPDRERVTERLTRACVLRIAAQSPAASTRRARADGVDCPRGEAHASH